MRPSGVESAFASQGAVLSKLSNPRWTMKKLMIIGGFVAALMLAPATGFANERLTDGLLGAGAGALVGGPVGALVGAGVGYTSGPHIANHLGAPRRHRYHRHTRHNKHHATHRRHYH